MGYPIYTGLPERLLEDIEAEMARADRKYGGLPDSEQERFVILAREVGEVAQEMPQPNSERRPTGDDHERSARLRTELIQLVGVALRWLR